MTVKYTTDGNVDGTVYGQAATSKLGFYGLATPIVQPAATAQSAVSTTALTTIGSTTLTATDLTSLNAIITRVTALWVLANQTRADLVALGLTKGSA